MNKKILVAIALTLALVMSLSSCTYVTSLWNSFFGETETTVAELTDAPLNEKELINFKDGANKDVLFESDGWSNGDVFNVVWKSHNVVYENGIMRLGITEEEASTWLDGQDVLFNYTAGEARTQNYYHYGDYAVSMKPSANPGTASTFFTCTGPYDLKNGTPNAHDEIDIEFLGKDTTHVQFNFFVDGKGGNEYMHELGFDASEGFHTYGFRWAEDSITWFVDGKPVYKVTTDTSVTEAKNLRIVEKLPSTAGRILANYWCGNERAWGWMGEYKGSVNDNGTEYQWIATSAEGAPLNAPAGDNNNNNNDNTNNDNTNDNTNQEIDWTAIAPTALGFASTEEYTVTMDGIGTAANITYTDISGSAYKNVEMDITEASAGKNLVYLKVTNNGTETVNVRVNLFDPTLTGNNQATNISATMNGVAVRTDKDWGGSFFDIPAGETAELVVNFGVGGIKLQLMIDSSRNDSTLRSGDITVEEIKFAALGEVSAPPTGDGPTDDPTDNPVTPPTDDTGLTFDYWTSNSSYTVSGNRVQYSGAGNSYACFGSDISAIAAGKNTFTVTVTNNGANDSRVRFDIQATTQIGNHTVCNVSATGGDVWTDMEWGGSIVTVAAGQSVTLVITYDENTERGAVTNLVIFIDAMRGDSNTYNSDITLSGMSFS